MMIRIARFICLYTFGFKALLRVTHTMWVEYQHFGIDATMRWSSFFAPSVQLHRKQSTRLKPLKISFVFFLSRFLAKLRRF